MSKTSRIPKHKQAFEIKIRQVHSDKKNNAETFTKEEFDKVLKFCQESQGVSDEGFKNHNKQLLSDDVTAQG